MVLEDQSYSFDCNYNYAGLGSSDSLVERHDKNNVSNNNRGKADERKDDTRLLSFKMPYQRSFRSTNWSELAESTMPLKTSSFMRTNASNGNTNYGGIRLDDDGYVRATGYGSPMSVGLPADEPNHLFHASLERRSKEMSRKLIYVNLISLLINLLLAIIAFYFSFVNNSSSTTAFAADCILDFISSAIVLWRYYGDLNDVYMHAREQIACIYLGALFEISALGIIIKASSDMASGVELEGSAPGYDLLYLATAAVIACSVLIWFKWSLYKTIRDKSILLDVINTVISTIFAITLCLMTVLSNFDSSFWYFDPVLSIVLAIFMAGFGIKVIHQNFNILRPGHCNSASVFSSPLAKLPLIGKDDDRVQREQCERGRYETNLNASLDYSRSNWQKTDHSTIAFV